MPVEPGASVRRDIVGGANDVFEMAVEQGKVLQLSIDKGDLALSTRLFGPTGDKLLEHVSQDFEVVEISLPADFAGSYRIELFSRERAETSRQYELTVESIKTVTALDRSDGDAQRAMAKAEVLRADWLEASLREAIEKYNEAAVIWTASGSFSNASRATLKAGDLFFLFGEYSKALGRYKDAAALARKARDHSAEARALSQLGRVYSYTGDNDRAQRQLDQAIDLLESRQQDETRTARNIYGEALSNLAEISYAKGDLFKSSEQFKRAGNALQGDRKGEAKVHLFKGYIAGGIGEPERALSEINRALDLYRSIDNKVGEGMALTLLGLWHTFKSDHDKAIQLHGSAIKIFRVVGDVHGEAIALNGLGQAYELLHELPIALDRYQQALQLFKIRGALDFVSVTTFKIAKVYSLMGNNEQAFAYYEDCLRLSRAAGKVRTEANALSEMAMLYASQGRHEQSLNQYKKLIRFYQSISDHRGQAVALNSQGDFLLALGQTRPAIDVYERALTLSERMGDDGNLLVTLYNLARANRNLGKLEVALSNIERSIDVIEELRTNVGSPDLRATYFSGVRKHYELCTDILMQLELAHPGKGFAVAALRMNEKARARSLIDLLHESNFDLREGATKELLERERELKGLIRSQAQYAMDLSLAKRDAIEIAEVDNQLAQLKSEFQAIQAQLREQKPGDRSITQFEPIDFKQIQSELLDSDTMLLEYSLGDERSYLWAVTSDSFHSYTLPGRKFIEDSAGEVYKLLTARQRFEGAGNGDYQGNVEASDRLCFEKASGLSEMLLGPVAEQIGTRRLVVVKEGALQHIPFAALPLPLSLSDGPGESRDTGRRYVLEISETIELPSISTLVAIRAAKKRSASTNRLVAVFADPVFSPNDDRVLREPQSESIAQAASSEGAEGEMRQTLPVLARGGALARLAYASAEADAILALAPSGTTWVAKGFDATRETAMSSGLGQYQILHFATHGFLDSEHPELSGVVLTMVDHTGAAKNGLMPLHDIYSLNLSAELTVLSACQTALGKDIKGEGLVGLTHSFLSAGSKSVVASLWKVDDRATATLMADFYESMLQKGMSPSAGLRAAQLKMLRETRWSAPYFWAPFVMQGDYANRIEVDHKPSPRLAFVLLSLLALTLAGLIVFRRWKRRTSPTQRT